MNFIGTGSNDNRDGREITIDFASRKEIPSNLEIEYYYSANRSMIARDCALINSLLGRNAFRGIW